MEREREEEHEGTKWRVSLKVNMDVVTAALQIGHPVAVPVPVTVPVVGYERRPLLTRPSHLPAVQDNPLHYEDQEESGSNDELWKGKAGLLKTNTLIKQLNISHRVKEEVFYN